MLTSDLLALLMQLESMGLRVVDVEEPLGRVTVEIPRLEEGQ